MFRLAVMIYVLAGTALAGSAVVAVLTVNLDQAWHIASAAIAGAVVAIPVSWLIAKQIDANFRRSA